MVFFGRGPTWCVDDCFNQSIKRDELRKNYRMFSGVRGGVPTPWPSSWFEFTDSDANTWSKGVWPKVACQDHWTITREEGIVLWGRNEIERKHFLSFFHMQLWKSRGLCFCVNCGGQREVCFPWIPHLWFVLVGDRAAFKMMLILALNLYYVLEYHLFWELVEFSVSLICMIGGINLAC